MKRKLLIGTVSCLMTLICANVMAENTDVSTLRHAIYIESLTVSQGTTEYTLSVKMKNEYESKGFSFAIFLPEGFAFSTTNGTPDAQLSNERTNSTHIDNFFANIQDDGALYVSANAQKGDGEIAGDKGEIALVKILLPENAAAGDYAIIVKNLSINVVKDGKTDDAVNQGYGTQELIESTLTIDPGQVLDENNTDPNAIKPATDVKVTVRRTINANAWSTICLPFDMTEEQTKEIFGNDVQLAYFTGYDVEKEGGDVLSITINFDEDDLSEGFYGNYPYLIKTSKDITEFELTTTIAPDAVQEIFSQGKGENKKSGKFIGTYQAETVVPENSLFLSGNQFWYSAGLTKMKAFRAYFTLSDVLSDVKSANVRIFVDIDDEETRVEGISTDDAQGTVYDLSGRKVSSPRHNGVYIINGKKVLK